jgi:hypothetical protein
MRLKPINVYGTPPKEGERIYVNTCRIKEKEDYNTYSWKVVRVDYVIFAETDEKISIRKIIMGQEPNSYAAQVTLAKIVQ